MSTADHDTIALHLDPATAANISILDARRTKLVEMFPAERFGAGLPDAVAVLAVNAFFVSAQVGLVARSILRGETQVEF